MIFKTTHNSPIGKLTLTCKDDKLIGLWIEGQKYFGNNINEPMIENSRIKLFYQTKNWIDRYFNNENPQISELPLAPIGSSFRKKVWQILCEIPYGEVYTYGYIAKIIDQNTETLSETKPYKKRMSAQAIGQAVGHNPISIIIPCHRVIGSNGSLTGYAAGIETKIKLLKHEGIKL